MGGERAYRAARRGETPELEPRPVTVHRAELLGQTAERATFEIECSAGTYVRSLIGELEDAYCEELERTRIGPFRLEDADPERLVPLAEALGFLPERPLDEPEHDGGRGTAGGCRPPARPRGSCASPATGELVAVAEPRDGELRPVVVFAPA